MSETERILKECRYLLSLSKNYQEIADYLNIDKQTVYNDLNYKLPQFDHILFSRVKKIIKK